MNIPLGSVVRDKVSGFTGVAENRAAFMYGCDRYCIQPLVGEDGKLPESAMFDEPQLEILKDQKRVMKPLGTPKQLIEMGQLVTDPIRGMSGTVIGRAVYLNGCSRVLVQPKQNKEIENWWVDEKQVEPKKTLTGKKKITKEPDDIKDRPFGGPAYSNSKY